MAFAPMMILNTRNWREHFTFHFISIKDTHFD